MKGPLSPAARVGDGLGDLRVVVDGAVVHVEVDGAVGRLGVEEPEAGPGEPLVVAVVPVLGLLDHGRPGRDARDVVADVAALPAGPRHPRAVEAALLVLGDGQEELARALGGDHAVPVGEVRLLAEVVDVAHDGALPDHVGGARPHGQAGLLPEPLGDGRAEPRLGEGALHRGGEPHRQGGALLAPRRHLAHPEVVVVGVHHPVVAVRQDAHRHRPVRRPPVGPPEELRVHVDVLLAALPLQVGVLRYVDDHVAVYGHAALPSRSGV